MPGKETEDFGRKDIEERTKIYLCDKVLSKVAMESRTEPDQRKTMDNAGLRSALGSAYCRSADELGDRRLRQLGLEMRQVWELDIDHEDGKRRDGGKADGGVDV
jgi:hypothetical protein